MVMSSHPPPQQATLEAKDQFFGRLVVDFLTLVQDIPAEGHVDIDRRHYCERMLELLVDVEVSGLLSIR